MYFSRCFSFAAVALAACTSISGTSQAADLERIVYDPGYAATVSIAGAFGELDVDEFEEAGYDLTSLIGSGDFVLPLHSNWNVQLSGAGRSDWLELGDGYNASNSQVLFNTLGFYRDPLMGLFGFDVGVYSLGVYPLPDAPRWSLIRAGGVAEWYPNEMFTIGAFGGGLFGLENQGDSSDEGEGWYIGGHATFYAQPNFAIGVDGRYLELSESDGPYNYDYGSLRVGGKARYLTSMSGVELFAAANYVRCDEDLSFGQVEGRSTVADGFEVLVGMNIRLGGNTNSLVEIDRSNAVDTRVWHCEHAVFVGSDRRLKTDIAKLTRTRDGIQLYSWKYKADPVTTWIGVMAQDLEETHPEALATGSDGFYRVDYSKLGVQMMTLEQWNARHL